MRLLRRMALNACRAGAHAAGKSYLRLFGWQLTGQPPGVPKHVLIAAPHTSNWDLVIMLACAWSYRLKVRWVGKKEIFDMPLLGRFLLFTGGLAVNRATARDTVAQIVAAFDASSEMLLCISPEGTRGRKDSWRSGFYHIALGARVPIACGFIDYGTRRAGYGPMFRPTGDVKHDMDVVRAFYADIKGLHPEKQSPVRLVEEDAPKTAIA